MHTTLSFYQIMLLHTFQIFFIDHCCHHRKDLCFFFRRLSLCHSPCCCIDFLIRILNDGLLCQLSWFAAILQLSVVGHGWLPSCILTDEHAVKHRLTSQSPLWSHLWSPRSADTALAEVSSGALLISIFCSYLNWLRSCLLLAILPLLKFIPSLTFWTLGSSGLLAPFW